ncbi:unnamed protein product [Camellia sinensis]|uniref:Uncharacterized protein n=2 Tax=Camellia sinensis TaxID=4442 RepID=A0A4S4ENK6_CAMSN|nr:hypothetical protein TEA_014775 [Camellia sinensis var. sinensis]
MTERRQGLRFQLPWLQAPPAPRPPQDAPTAESQTPIQPTMTRAQRPPFRPPGSAQAPVPPQAQASPRTESQPSSPSRATARTRVTSQTASSSRAMTQSRAASQLPSPSRAAAQSKAATQPPSPSRVTPQTKDAPQPSSASPKALETQPASQAAPQPQSPPKLASQPAAQTSALPSSPSLTATQAQLQPTTKEGPELPPVSTELPLPISQEEPKPARSQPESQKPQLKAERTSENVFNTQDKTPSQITSTTAVETPVPTQKSDSSLVGAEPKPLQKSDGIPEETIEGKEMVQELGNKQKINGVNEEPKERTVTELTEAPGSKEPTKMQPSVAFEAEQEKVKDEIISRKETLATSNSNQKQTKIVISNLKDKNTVTDSRHKPTIPKGEQTPLHKEIRDDISKFVNKMANQQPKHLIDEKPVTVITLAGENRGASMQLGSESAKKDGAIHIHRAYKINPDESNEATTDGEGSSKGRQSKDSKTEEDQASKTYINSNVQAINNSIMLNGSITERNPGVQMVHSHKLTEPVKPTRRMGSLETHKAEFNVTSAQKLTYKPTIRRRCLRGLFMESSDSDPDNPEKPRRHGCRYGCKRRRDNETDVL